MVLAIRCERLTSSSQSPSGLRMTSAASGSSTYQAPFSTSLRSCGVATRITGLDRSTAPASADQPRRTAQTRARLDLLMTAAPFEVDGASVDRECVAAVSERLHPSRAATVVRKKRPPAPESDQERRRE